ncbi:MAG TPA: histidine phosphatase family protein [Saprospiraceae bacterium]|nr:histidine phosphatase family protein [Saprospiraceae bacterium]
MREKTLYIIRHGETEHNRLGIVQGRGVDSELNETGIRQAEAFFRHYRDIPFDRIYCSSQTRSYQTIRLFESTGQEIYRDDRLDEINWGEHEGKAGEPELMSKYHRIIQSWSSGDYHDAPAGGESAHELSLRLWSFIEEIEKADFQTALISTHGRTLRAMICMLKKQPLSLMEQVRHHNTGLYLTTYKHPEWAIQLENDLLHLTQKLVH